MIVTEQRATLGFDAACEIRPGGMVVFGGRVREVIAFRHEGREWPYFQLKCDIQTDWQTQAGPDWVSWMTCGAAWIALEGKDLWKAIDEKFQSGDRSWTATTKEQFHESLNVLPPERWKNSAFLVGEPVGSIKVGDKCRPTWNAFRCVGDRYDARIMTIPEFEFMFRG